MTRHSQYDKKNVILGFCHHAVKYAFIVKYKENKKKEK